MRIVTRFHWESFEEQLQYLQDSGYYSVTWQEWSAAMAYKKASVIVALTFDDGFMDFIICLAAFEKIWLLPLYLLFWG
jgi:peptidoglycan/xylan/chitin deacetylase (PgdA/CDA1 family)